MSWLSIIGKMLFYISLPFTLLLKWVSIALSPILHLLQFVASIFFLPLRFLAKFETLYIFLGVASSIGVVAGFLLYVSSTVLVSLFNLNPVPEEKGRTAASVRAAREKKKLERAWQASVPRNEDGVWRSDGSVEKKYAEWLDKGGKGPRREDGLLGQTILEEDDDSDVF